METMTEDSVQLEAVAPALRACPPFQALKDEHFSQILKIAEPVRFAAEEVVVEEGSEADAFYIILEAKPPSGSRAPEGGRKPPAHSRRRRGQEGQADPRASRYLGFSPGAF